MSSDGPLWDRPPACQLATPLAIIGIGCLFPKAPDAGAYWLNVKHGVDAIGPVPSTHWKPEDYLDPDPKSPDRTYTARGGFLDPVDFRPLDFGIAPNDLEAIDSTQLLGLVAAREALLDAGYGPERAFDRNRVSVILGVTGTLELVIPLGARLGHPRWRKALKDAGIPDAKAEEIIRDIGDSYVGWQENSFPGLLGNVVAGRIANRLDLGGTNCVVDAACASSLGAIHLAGLELAAGCSDMVITGGVDAFNDIFMYMCFSKTPALSPTGNAKPFDAAGDGTILGEGLGIVVLKRLDDARRDGDRVYAIIKGLGSSSDGKGNAIYAPSANGQMKALREAYRLAGVTPDTIELVEAHGTGTRVGDSVEVEALGQVYREAKADGTWCALGSVKSQIGHTKAAAGAAGLIKAALALHHKVLPPTIKVEQPIDGLKDSPLYINAERRPWPANPNHPRRAAVSAFGFGGSNFHCVLEEAEPEKTTIDWDGEIEIAALSAANSGALQDQLGEWSSLREWNDIRLAAAGSRTGFAFADPVRLLLVLQRGAVDLPKLVDAVRAKLRTEPEAGSWKLPEGAYFGTGVVAGKLAVLFPGQGSQYPNMLRDLACLFPEMQRVLADADSEFRLSDRIYPPFAFTKEDRELQEQRLRQTDVAQPAIGAVSLGAFKVLQSFGIEPDAYAGHSYGELPALCAAGCFDEQTLHSISRLRGQLMASYRGDDAGGMVAVHAPLAIVETVLREDALDLVVANRNAPNQSVLSGASAEIDRAIASLSRLQIHHTRLAVAAAFHSPMVASAQKPFREALDAVAFQTATRPIFANTTGELYPTEPNAIRDLVSGQLALPVRFVDEIRRMADEGVRTFLEVGPGSTLTKLATAILAEKNDCVALAIDASSGKKAGTLDLANALACLAARGHRVDLSQWQRTGKARTTADHDRKGLIVPICGANYVAPKKKYTSPRLAPTRSPKVIDSPKPMIESHVFSNGHHPSTPATANGKPQAHASPEALSQALSVTQQSLAAFQKLQEQTAQLHKQFLENQEAAQRTLQLLVEQQHTLLRGGSAAPVSFAAVRAPVPAVKHVETNGAPHHRNGHAPATHRLAPVASPARIEIVRLAPKQPSVDAAAILMAVVAEKTGYPAEMLAPEMALDADLGIDSIKRVEIFSALQEKLPDAPVVKPEHLGSLHTLGDVLVFLEPAAAARVESTLACAAGSGSPIDASSILFAVVAEKTGYPVEMLAPEMALDADLGIDSIKRVEIFSALQEKLPHAPVVKPEHLGSLHTLADVVAFLNNGCEAQSAAHPAAPQKKTADLPESTDPLALIECRVLRVVPLKARSDGAIQLEPGSSIYLVGDDSALCESLRQAIEKSGHSVDLRDWADDSRIDKSQAYAGLLLVAPHENLLDLPLRSLCWMQRLQPSLLSGSTFFATITRLGGTFGLDGLQAAPESGALAGLAKTAAHEWPSMQCKAIDVAESFDDADAIWDEILQRGPVEVGFTDSGKVELTLEARPRPLDNKPLFTQSDVVLISGGGRGVTAAVALAIAEQSAPTILLMGRSDIDWSEPEILRGCETEAAVKKALSQHLKQSTPRAIEAEYRRIVARREVLATLEALRHAGSRAEYFAADVTDAESVGRTTQAIRAKVGLITCLIHGAGVLADRRIENLSEADFNSVYSTKVAGLKNLLREIDQDPLRALVLFSSSTGRFGRTGQAAYAAANEALNKIAQHQARQRPDCKVVSINWGPWDGGMVTPALRKLFADEGVGVIPLREGGQILLRELAAPRSDVEVTVIARPTAASTAAILTPVFERLVNLADHPVLRSHIIDGRVVLPLALHLEWLAHAALHGNPGLVFHGVNDLRVLHGVQFDPDESAPIAVLAGKPRKQESLFIVPVEMRGRRNGKDIVHSRAEIVLASRLPGSIAPQEPLDLPPAEFDVPAAYERLLFHGDDLQGIETIYGIGEHGIVVDCRSAPAPSQWLKQPLRGVWIADPLVLDCALQAMIVWSSVIRGAGCLPSFVGSYRQFRRSIPAGTLSLAVAITRQTGAIVRANIDVLDDDGALVARIEDHESVIGQSLNLAFRHNRLEQEAALVEGGVR